MKRFLRASILVTVMSFCCASLPAQSFGDLLKKASDGLNLGSTAKDYVSALLGKDKVAAEDWAYVTNKCKEALAYIAEARK